MRKMLDIHKPTTAPAATTINSYSFYGNCAIFHSFINRSSRKVIESEQSVYEEEKKPFRSK